MVLEGMGRAIHTNLRAKFSCDVVKLAMIKNSRLARKIFGGTLYDCVFRFEPAGSAGEGGSSGSGSGMSPPPPVAAAAQREGGQ